MWTRVSVSVSVLLLATLSFAPTDAFYANQIICSTNNQCAGGWCGTAPDPPSNVTVCLAPQAGSNRVCDADYKCRSQWCDGGICKDRPFVKIGGGINAARCISTRECDTGVGYICKSEVNECGYPGSRLNSNWCGVSEHCDTNQCNFETGQCFARSCSTHYQCPRDMHCAPESNSAGAKLICKKKERNAFCGTNSLSCSNGWCLGQYCGSSPIGPIFSGAITRAEEVTTYSTPVNQSCFASVQCQTGLYCAQGDVCQVKLPVGAACRSTDACTSGYCKNGFCVEPGTVGTWCTVDANCTATNYCSPVTASNTKKCAAKGTVGAGCSSTNHQMCLSGICDGSRCVKNNGVGATCGVGGVTCDYDAYCDSSTSKCAAKLQQNSQCTDNIQCMSGTCTNDQIRVCAASVAGSYGHFCQNSATPCDAGLYCRTGISPVVCLPKGDTGAACTSADRCLSGVCSGTPLRCVVPGELGSPCTSHANCTAGVSYCPSSGTRVCTALQGIGAPCAALAADKNVSCSSGWCVRENCYAPIAKGAAGSTCVTHSDCDAGLWCYTTPEPNAVSLCAAKRTDGNKCMIPETCISGNCGNNICGGSPTPNGYQTEATAVPTTPVPGTTVTPTSTPGTTTQPPSTTPMAGTTTAPPTTTTAPPSTTPGPTGTPAVAAVMTQANFCGVLLAAMCGVLLMA